MKTSIEHFCRVAFRVIAAASVIGVVAGLAFRAAPPSGYLSVTTDLRAPAPFVTGPKPSERMEADAGPGSGGRLLLGEPIYFDLTPPSAFEEVTMRVAFENAGKPIVEIGAMGSSLDRQFDVRPAQSVLLDTLPWERRSSGRLALYQRTPKYASVDDFLRDPPARERIAVYHAEDPVPFRIKGYAASSRERRTAVSLRGSHRLAVYIKEETASVAFETQDMNRVAGADPAILSLYAWGGKEPIAQTVLDDDGNTAGDQRSSGLRTVSISVADLPEGPYVIDLSTTDDLFVRGVVSRQGKLVFLGRMYLGDQVGYSDEERPRTVIVSGRTLTARTPHIEGMQTLTLGRSAIALDEPIAKFSRRLPPSDAPVPLTSPKGDVLLETDGAFALDRDAFFDPLPYSVGWHTTAEDLRADGIAYVLAEYEPPASEGSARVAEATFRTGDLARTENGAFRFSVSVPGFQDVPSELRIARVTFVMRRAPSSWIAALASLVKNRFAADDGSHPVPFGRSYGESPE